MALYSFTDALRFDFKRKIYLADTSFLLPAAKLNTAESKVKARVLSQGGAIAYNVTARHEVMHYLRRLLIEQAITNGSLKLNDRVQRLISTLENQNREHELLKQLCDSGYASLFREVFGENGERLKAEVEIIFHGCIYRDTASILKTGHLSWDRVYQLMAIYGLDSSDAMITNLAVSDGTFSGLIANDKDYRVCGAARNNFDVFLPDAAVRVPADREWRAKP